MKKVLAVLVCCVSMLPSAFSQTQNAEESENNSGPVRQLLEQDVAIFEYEIPADIFDNMEMNPGQLRNPNAVQASGKKPAATKSGKGNQKNQGFRIQVFGDGRNPGTLQARAKARGNAIVAKFPKYRGQVYTFSSSPNWYTRIGNFKTSQEASAALAELKRAFPSFAAEMRVVKSQITVRK